MDKTLKIELTINSAPQLYELVDKLCSLFGGQGKTPAAGSRSIPEEPVVMPLKASEGIKDEPEKKAEEPAGEPEKPQADALSIRDAMNQVFRKFIPDYPHDRSSDRFKLWYLQLKKEFISLAKELGYDKPSQITKPEDSVKFITAIMSLKPNAGGVKLEMDDLPF